MRNTLTHIETVIAMTSHAPLGAWLVRALTVFRIETGKMSTMFL